MDRRDLLRLAPRLALAWGALTLLVAMFSAPLIVGVRPLLQACTEQLMPGFSTLIMPAVGPGAQGDVVMEFEATRPVTISGDHQVAPWIKVRESINSGHEFVPVILLLSVLAAWPYRQLRQALWALCGGVLASAVLLVWTVSVHFAGLYEISLQRVASYFHEARGTPFFLTLMIFDESGGQWLLGLLAAVAVALLVSGVPTSLKQGPPR